MKALRGPHPPARVCVLHTYTYTDAYMHMYNSHALERTVLQRVAVYELHVDISMYVCM